jgi:hypothetical protein
MELPNDIIVAILNTAELSIDGRLAMKRYFGASIKWGRVTVDDALRRKLDGICERRTANFAKYARMLNDNSFRWCTTIDQTVSPIKVDRNTFLEISVTDFGGNDIEICVKTTRLTDSPVWSMRISAINCDIHTGVVTPEDAR